MLKKRLALITMSVMLSAGVLAGCGQKSASDSTKKNIALIVKSTDSEYWLSVKAGAEKAAKEAGANIIFKGPATEQDIQGEVNIVEDAINQKVDGIVLAASDTKALIQPVENAINAKIPLVTVDSGVDSDKVASFIATDNEKAASQAADVCAELIGKSGKVGVVNFVPGVSTAVQREKGFRDGMSKHSGIELLKTQYSQSDKSKAMAITEDILTANPDVKAIFAANNRSALGVAQALKGKGVAGKVKVVAFDADPDEIKGIEDGSITALIVQNPYKMGEEGVKNVLALMKGETVEKRIDTGVTIVTKENINDPEVQKVLYPEKNK
ncbi:LacI family transcriptional regulator [Clostridium tetani]|uniref:D-ribose-binding periplasmic protein n=2 Tax=Clostridium tetani TaxID=1513 RepID=Q896U1_CLOTE|nr:ABC transporter substrate-binding protein [Clostridium tetani]AAO35499.1 D-ribose-binding periplasmic protein [Clostridium tetani E88]AVP55080.1 sugar ABC transporter substrate-binding protein [Clostridium tetani]KGI37105.1 sugar ABC transporter substrate-binding protein [Clostridium tetani]KGI40495.1 sugar ABC transporter substrate-binding protein [Clostridium tetani ATCC 9441]KGI42325.1 sugar ABC transporter substrate-binding protein [Clostridium tetani]